MWAVLDTDHGTRLCAPFITAYHADTRHLDDSLIWSPGPNTASTLGCPERDHGKHPLASCRCGLRVMRSLTDLRAFATDQAYRVGPLVAFAEVDVWGKVAPFSPADDWAATLRAEHAAIVGPLHLVPARAGDAETLAEHYGIEVILDPPQCAHWGEYGAAGLLVVDKGKVLLQLRPQGVFEGGTWSIPGGARGNGEAPEDAALREAGEEAGIDPDAVEIIGYYTHTCACGWQYDTCIANPVGALDLAGNWESKELRWVPLTDVDTLPLHPGLYGTWPDLRDMIVAHDSEPNITQITDRIWTGGDRGPAAMLTYLTQVQLAGITHIIDCRPFGRSDQQVAQALTPHLGYLLNGQDDNGQPMPGSWFDVGVDYALAALADPDAQVLTHCQLGWNRGPSMALAILLATGMEPDTALAMIRAARPTAEVAYADDAISWWQRSQRLPT